MESSFGEQGRAKELSGGCQFNLLTGDLSTRHLQLSYASNPAVESANMRQSAIPKPDKRLGYPARPIA